MNNNGTITLFSSDATVQYAKDVLSVLALPRGCAFKFRYENRYIDPDVLQHLQEGRNLEKKAIVAFRSAYDQNAGSEDFFIPIRLVTITYAEKMAGGYIVNFVAGGYPCFMQDDRVSSLSDMRERAAHVFQSRQLKRYAVWGRSVPCVNISDDPSRDEENWREICKCISLLPGYESCYFLKCSSPYTEKWDDAAGGRARSYSNFSHGTVPLQEGVGYYVDVEYFEQSYNKDRNRRIETIVDDAVLMRTRGMSTALQSRYGTIKLGFRPRSVDNHSVSEIVIKTVGAKSSLLETEITIPISILKSRARRVAGSLTASAGALLIALPGILGSVVPLAGSIAIGFAGVLMVGACNYWYSRWE